jgi:RHS repeat-associated protein
LLGTYQYDDGDKLNVAQRGSPVASTIQYGYDSVGNRKTTTLDAGSITAVYGTTNNHLESMSGSLPAGYMLGASNVVFTYNNANRLVGIQADGANVASYLVNGLGQRVQKSAGGSVTIFVYDEAGHLLGEYDGTGALIQETVWMEDMPVATLRPSGGGVTVYYVHPDHLGTPRAITRPSDNVFMWRWDNTEAFGNSQPNENPAGQGTFKYGLRFPGQYYDAEIGTNYNYFRDYDPSIGRYVESDPMGLYAGLNTYGYANSGPLSFADPLGLCKIELRFKLIPWFSFRHFYHAFIVTNDHEGPPMYFRGGPTGGNTSFGDIGTNYGTYVPGTKDFEVHNIKLVILDNDEPCDCYNSSFAGTLDRIKNAHFSYNPLTRNSNSVAGTALTAAGLNVGPLPVDAPGFNTTLGPK